MDEIARNIAFIDGQNLYMGTAKRKVDPWKINLRRFRVYLKEKYAVDRAYYFLGYVQNISRELYDEIQNTGFILKFREHNRAMIGKKKGNVDSDIIFHIMKKIYKKEDFGKVLIVSGDGDYKLLVDFLIEEQRFGKILFPDLDRASSLYKNLSNNYFASLDDRNVRAKISMNYSDKKKRVP
ncbi:MAG: NYN domain-containing protein [Candidatus Paceibacterota bacterium]|jgi:uncharacterized LabA/DUF88 family protein